MPANLLPPEYPNVAPCPAMYRAATGQGELCPVVVARLFSGVPHNGSHFPIPCISRFPAGLLTSSSQREAAVRRTLLKNV